MVKFTEMLMKKIVLIGIDERHPWIHLKQCKPGHLYLVHARNSHLGIFKPETKAFIISRFKFKENFLFEEYHWDTGRPYGTAKPLLLIEKVDMTMSEDKMLKYLNKKLKEIDIDIWTLPNSKIGAVFHGA